MSNYIPLSKQGKYTMAGLVLFVTLIILTSLPLCSAEIQTLGTQKVNTCVDLPQVCSSCSYVNISSIKLPDSSMVLLNLGMEKNGVNYNYTYCSVNQTGNYIVTTCGDKDGTFQCASYDFTVTPNREIATSGSAIFYIGIMAVLVIFLIMAIYTFMNTTGLLTKVGMFGLGYLLLIAITFIGWNMAQDFITSSPFIISMLNILFIVLVVGFFPLIIGGFVWYFLMVFKIKEIENLMKHGMTEYDATERVKRRHR
jgi:hypothetical protein